MVKVLCVFASIFLFGCAASKFATTDSSFRLIDISGKNVRIENGTYVDFAGDMDENATYAKAKFNKIYSVDTAYSNFFIRKFAESFDKTANAKSSRLCINAAWSECQNQDYDFTIRLEKLFFHNSLALRSEYSIYDRTNRRVAKLDIENVDKFDVKSSSDDRITRAFINLSKADSLNLSRDWIKYQ